MTKQPEEERALKRAQHAAQRFKFAGGGEGATVTAPLDVSVPSLRTPHRVNIGVLTAVPGTLRSRKLR
jgi:hypothetical protein